VTEAPSEEDTITAAPVDPLTWSTEPHNSFAQQRGFSLLLLLGSRQLLGDDGRHCSSNDQFCEMRGHGLFESRNRGGEDM
jgi:hypothetical protein